MISVHSPDASQLETATQWPVWEKEACNFDEDYTATEMFYILDGEARLTTACGIDKTIRQETSSPWKRAWS
ncbi:cupin domain-containing protein [Aliamphritea spongicola]|nr:cupin domain-containing protein [Aliamphritea spongicola]